MRRVALLTVPLAVLITVPFAAPPALAMCPMTGVYPQQSSARPAEVVRLHIVGGVGRQCVDVIPPPGTPIPAPPVTRVTVSMERIGERIVLRTFRQRGYSAAIDVRIPAGAAPGPWRFVTDSRLRSDSLFLVSEPRPAPPTLPRTGSAAPALAALGAWLVVAGAHAVRAAPTRPARRG